MVFPFFYKCILYERKSIVFIKAINELFKPLTMMIVNFSRKIFAIKPVNCFIAHSVVQTHIHIYM